jgi:hypothetical protein
MPKGNPFTNMKLYATTISERGKPVSKSGNECLVTSIQDESRNAIIVIALNFDALGQWHIAKAHGCYRAMWELRAKLDQSIKDWIQTEEQLERKM